MTLHNTMRSVTQDNRTLTINTVTDTLVSKKRIQTVLVSSLISVMAVSAQAADTATQLNDAPSAAVAQNVSSTTSSIDQAPIDQAPIDKAPISVSESTNGIIAVVNDTPILKSELSAAIASTQARIKASGQPVPSAQQLQNDVLNSLIMRQLQLNIVQRAGIRPDANAVDQSLARIAQSQGLTSLSQLQQTLDAKQPGSYANLRAQIAEEESLKALQQSQISSRVRITEQDVDAFLASPEAQRLKRAEYRTIHIRVPFSDDYSRITENEKKQAMQIAEQTQNLLKTSNDAQFVLDQLSSGIAKNYIAPVQGGDMGFHEAAGLPTDIASKITQLNIGEVTQPNITPAGIDIVKLVDIRNDENTVIPQWKVRHILVKTDNLNNDALAEQKINDLYEQLRRDANFASLAATYSDDPGSAGRGGDLDWVTEGQMVPEFEEMMKRTPTGDYSTPFKSQFGWHILKVEDMREKDVSETIKRNQARDILFQRLAPQAQEDWLQELRANAFIQVFK